MANAIDRRPGIRLTSRYLVRDGVPWIPVSGEIHYSRVPRARWAERLRQMRAGGITVVAGVRHLAPPRAPNAVPRTSPATSTSPRSSTRCAAAGLDVVLRIGPWVPRRGPQRRVPRLGAGRPGRGTAPTTRLPRARRDWFGQLGGGARRPLQPSAGARHPARERALRPARPPGHAQALAREAGLSAPLWTATAWGGAELPESEVLPLYGGYGDGFWVDAGRAVGPDLPRPLLLLPRLGRPGHRRRPARGAGIAAAPPRTPSAAVPARHLRARRRHGDRLPPPPRPTRARRRRRRPLQDRQRLGLAGLLHVRRGTNPRRATLQESHATGYPNDLPRARATTSTPRSARPACSRPATPSCAGSTRSSPPSADRLARCRRSLPDERPTGVDDRTHPALGLRGDGEQGFLFIAWHQPHVPLPATAAPGSGYRSGTVDVEFPTRPVDIPPGTLRPWPRAA